MYCDNCGAELADDAGFCSNCGKEIGKQLSTSYAFLKIEFRHNLHIAIFGLHLFFMQKLYI